MTERQGEPRPAATGAAQQGVLGFTEITSSDPQEQAGAELGKLRALAALTARYADKVRAFQAAFVEALLVLPGGEAASADVARARLGVTDPCPKWIGAAVNGLALADIIERAGDAPGRRPLAHGRRTTLWRLRDRDAARAWLESHVGRAGA